jgi:hypothetical protein
MLRTSMPPIPEPSLSPSALVFAGPIRYSDACSRRLPQLLARRYAVPCMADQATKVGCSRSNLEPPLGDDPERQEMLAELECIRLSRTFAGADRLIEFLDFVVKAAVAGDSQLKETTIGVGLYHRSPTYDPKADAIVRTRILDR